MKQKSVHAKSCTCFLCLRNDDILRRSSERRFANRIKQSQFRLSLHERKKYAAIKTVYDDKVDLDCYKSNGDDNSSYYSSTLINKGENENAGKPLELGSSFFSTLEGYSSNNKTEENKEVYKTSKSQILSTTNEIKLRKSKHKRSRNSIRFKSKLVRSDLDIHIQSRLSSMDSNLYNFVSIQSVNSLRTPRFRDTSEKIHIEGKYQNSILNYTTPQRENSNELAYNNYSNSEFILRKKFFEPTKIEISKIMSQIHDNQNRTVVTNEKGYHFKNHNTQMRILNDAKGISSTETRTVEKNDNMLRLSSYLKKQPTKFNNSEFDVSRPYQIDSLWLPPHIKTALISLPSNHNKCVQTKRIKSKQKQSIKKECDKKVDSTFFPKRIKKYLSVIFFKDNLNKNNVHHQRLKNKEMQKEGKEKPQSYSQNERKKKYQFGNEITTPKNQVRPDIFEKSKKSFTMREWNEDYISNSKEMVMGKKYKKSKRTVTMKLSKQKKVNVKSKKSKKDSLLTSGIIFRYCIQTLSNISKKIKHDTNNIQSMQHKKNNVRLKKIQYSNYHRRNPMNLSKSSFYSLKKSSRKQRYSKETLVLNNPATCILRNEPEKCVRNDGYVSVEQRKNMRHGKFYTNMVKTDKYYTLSKPISTLACKGTSGSTQPTMLRSILKDPGNQYSSYNTSYRTNHHDNVSFLNEQQGITISSNISVNINMSKRSFNLESTLLNGSSFMHQHNSSISQNQFLENHQRQIIDLRLNNKNIQSQHADMQPSRQYFHPLDLRKSTNEYVGRKCVRFSATCNSVLSKGDCNIMKHFQKPSFHEPFKQNIRNSTYDNAPNFVVQRFQIDGKQRLANTHFEKYADHENKIKNQEFYIKQKNINYGIDNYQSHPLVEIDADNIGFYKNNKYLSTFPFESNQQHCYSQQVSPSHQKIQHKKERKQTKAQNNEHKNNKNQIDIRNNAKKENKTESVFKRCVCTLKMLKKQKSHNVTDLKCTITSKYAQKQNIRDSQSRTIETNTKIPFVCTNPNGCEPRNCVPYGNDSYVFLQRTMKRKKHSTSTSRIAVNDYYNSNMATMADDSCRILSSSIQSDFMPSLKDESSSRITIDNSKHIFFKEKVYQLKQPNQNIVRMSSNFSYGIEFNKNPAQSFGVIKDYRNSSSNGQGNQSTVMRQRRKRTNCGHISEGTESLFHRCYCTFNLLSQRIAKQREPRVLKNHSQKYKQQKRETVEFSSQNPTLSSNVLPAQSLMTKIKKKCLCALKIKKGIYNNPKVKVRECTGKLCFPERRLHGFDSSNTVNTKLFANGIEITQKRKKKPARYNSQVEILLPYSERRYSRNISHTKLVNHRKIIQRFSHDLSKKCGCNIIKYKEKSTKSNVNEGSKMQMSQINSPKNKKTAKKNIKKVLKSKSFGKSKLPQNGDKTVKSESHLAYLDNQLCNCNQQRFGGKFTIVSPLIQSLKQTKVNNTRKNLGEGSSPPLMFGNINNLCMLNAPKFDTNNESNKKNLVPTTDRCQCCICTSKSKKGEKKVLKTSIANVQSSIKNAKKLFNVSLDKNNMCVINKEDVSNAVTTLGKEQEITANHDPLCQCCFCKSKRKTQYTIHMENLRKLKEKSLETGQPKSKRKRNRSATMGQQSTRRKNVSMAKGKSASPTTKRGDAAPTTKRGNAGLSTIKKNAGPTKIVDMDDPESITENIRRADQLPKGPTRQEKLEARKELRNRSKQKTKSKQVKLKEKSTLKKENLKQKVKHDKQEQKSLIKSVKQRTKEDQKRRARRKKEDRKAMRELKKCKDSGDIALLAESGLDLTKLTFRGVGDIARPVYRFITDPRKCCAGLRKNLKDGNLNNDIKDSSYVSTLRRIKIRLQCMRTTKAIVELLESNRFTYFLIHMFDKHQKPFVAKAPVKEPVNFNCSLFMGSLRKRPCLCVYYKFANLYPNFLSIFRSCVSCLNVLVLCTAVLVWTPCILAVELARATMCCVACTG